MNSSKSFQLMVKRIRKAMPFMATAILIGVYGVSAYAAGLFLSTLLSGMSGGAWLGFAIGIAIQGARGTLVFFPQLNPSRPNFSYTGEVIAVIMGLVSIGEILALVGTADLAMPVGVSLSILMAMGVLVEIFILREVRFATESELIGDRSKVQELQQFYQKRVYLKLMLSKLAEIEADGILPEGIEVNLLDEPKANPTKAAAAEEKEEVEEPAPKKEVAIPLALTASPNGKGH